MQKDKDELVCGVLDIYGFEIFMVSGHINTGTLYIVDVPVVHNSSYTSNLT